MFHSQVTLLREIFQKNGHLENFIDSCFKFLLSRVHILKEKVPTVLPYLGTISLQIKTAKNCKNISKRCLTVANYSLFSKLKISFVTAFSSKTIFPKFLCQVWFTSFSVDYAMNLITEDVLGILL